MSSDRYIGAGNASDPERERLGLLERLSDPSTTGRMSKLGVSDGWTCAEVAAGSGSVATWLSDRVGPTGRVLATDIDMRFLDALDLPNVEVREHDITGGPLEGSFDLVHARALLLHLTDPAAALRNMVAALRPGGWLFVEDPDVSTIKAADPTHPDAEAFDARIHADNRTFAAMGVFDPCSGPKVVGLMDTLGLIEVDHVALSRVERGGSDAALFMSLGSEMARPLLVEHAGVSHEGFDAQQARYADPTFSFCEMTTYQCWGRRPH